MCFARREHTSEKVCSFSVKFGTRCHFIVLSPKTHKGCLSDCCFPRIVHFGTGYQRCPLWSKKYFRWARTFCEQRGVHCAARSAQPFLGNDSSPCVVTRRCSTMQFYGAFVHRVSTQKTKFPLRNGHFLLQNGHPLVPPQTRSELPALVIVHFGTGYQRCPLWSRQKIFSLGTNGHFASSEGCTVQRGLRKPF